MEVEQQQFGGEADYEMRLSTQLIDVGPMEAEEETRRICCGAAGVRAHSFSSVGSNEGGNGPFSGDKDKRKAAEVVFCNNAITTSKYTLNPFSPSFIIYLNLFEQFRRLANVYFLFIAILQLIPGVSPTGQFTTILPLGFVMTLSMLKDAYEDVQRHRQDRELNNRTARILRGGEWGPRRWADIAVGDIIEVGNRDGFAADLIVLSTSEPDGLCYIETSSLDGETNLKMKKAVPLAYEHFSPASAAAFSAVATTELPNNRLETFSGNLRIGDATVPIGNDNVVLRGACLRNTAALYGLVVFTGKETKLMKNSSGKRLKMSAMDGITNRQVLFVFVMQIVICVLCTIGLAIYADRVTPSHWYLAPDTGDSYLLTVITGFATFLILFNNLIPISLYVSMEMVKLAQAYFISNDATMYHPETNTAAMARTSALNEELGQVSYVFSDKTGTLTCNMMDFVKMACVVGGGGGEKGEEARTLATFGEGVTEIARAAAARAGTTIVDPRPEGFGDGFYDPAIMEGRWAQHPDREALCFFIVHLAVCHTVVIERDERTGEPTFQASSPDEACLVKAAKALGVAFVARTERTITVSVLGEERSYELLHVIPFDSTRKRMSTVVRAPDGSLMLLCKGADNVVVERLRRRAGDEALIGDLHAQLGDYGSEGLRTLVLAAKTLEEDVYAEWAARYEAAGCAVVARDEKVAAVGAEVEAELELVGATAIEDKLQRGVAATIELLIAAGVRVWVLTGDKQETAINIGFACALLNTSMSVMTFDDVEPSGMRRRLLELTRDANEAERLSGGGGGAAEAADLGLVIQGHLLINVFEDDGLSRLFLELARRCKAVICCRVSPLQKAQVVSLVKKNITSAVTLAIGDGANDVSMIQAAHVGVGISGLEGLQAARASDYSIAQFRFLQPLLLVHGRYNYRRIARLILYSFYKNMALYLSQLWFCLFNAFSGQSLIDSWALSCYNVMFTAFPVMVIATLDRDVERERLLHTQQFPELFQDGVRGRLFTTKRFWAYAANALFHSAVAFFVPYYGFCTVVNAATNSYPDIAGLGVLCYTTILFIVTGKAALETLSWTWANVFVCVGSIAVWFAFLAAYSRFFAAFKVGDFAGWYGVPSLVMPSAAFWLVLAVSVAIALGRDVAFKFARRHFDNRELSHVVQVLEHKHRHCGGDFTRRDVPPHERHLLMRLETLEPKPSARRFVSIQPSGFAFSQDEGQAEGLRAMIRGKGVQRARTKLLSLLKRNKSANSTSSLSDASAIGNTDGSAPNSPVAAAPPRPEASCALVTRARGAPSVGPIASGGEYALLQAHMGIGDEAYDHEVVLPEPTTVSLGRRW